MNHYSPISDKWEISLCELEDELMQLKRIFGGGIKQINLLGGEPLLHSDIVPLMSCVREYFIDSRIVILTNGILLMNQNEAFWEAAAKEKVEIEVTKYPIKINYKEIRKKAKRHKVKFTFYGRSGYVQKTLFYLPLDIDGSQNGTYSFENCFMARQCFTLKNGRIFPCPYAAFVDRFNHYFGKNIPITTKDYGDIWKESKEEILEKLSRPIPMCRFCNVKGRSYGNKWRLSDKDIKEWT